MLADPVGVAQILEKLPPDFRTECGIMEGLLMNPIVEQEYFIFPYRYDFTQNYSTHVLIIWRDFDGECDP